VDTYNDQMLMSEANILKLFTARRRELKGVVDKIQAGSCCCLSQLFLRDKKGLRNWK